MTTNEYSSVLDEASRTIGSLLWQLWHHQGYNSPIGQPIRKVLNIARDAAMTDEQVAAAKRYGETLLSRMPTAATPPAPVEARPDSIWAMMSGPMSGTLHKTTDDEKVADGWKAVGIDVTEYVPRASIAPVEAVQAPAGLTNEHVRLSLLQGGLIVGEHNTNLVADALRKLLCAPAVADSGGKYAMHVGNSQQTDACAVPEKSESRSKSKVKPAVIHSLATFDQMPDSAYIDVHVVAGLFDVALQTIWRRARIGVLPKPRKFGGSTRWNVGELRAVLSGNPGPDKEKKK
ncbi:hypothetical protein OVY01_20830 [Robbsia sp. Bb-Pol-6]|uniref:Uncharacterized protein n=1 Tax=Robbsia betulipollinis TaxID=2981849 RepID=A0ABT3ZTQ4_9BURK|nr:hypothetical protein [Robbsia betulipollinis]MCY0389595.1 hypothetical protein [Robbsia betulipollinis]